MDSVKMAENINFASPEAAFEKYADTVYRLAFVRTKSSNDSDDILQEVFLRYLKVWQKMQSEEHVKAMLLRITVNCSNSLKTSFWFKKTEGLDEKLVAPQTCDETDVLSAVLKLPVKYRTVIHLHYYCGYSVNEIAKIEKLNPSTVKTHLSRARAILKKTIKADDL
ncbi:MAG: sigma-70 family RNA polymerase sigma factor [Clostridia bacterium]|nr:sigma-70 family RNA polymerase sigma factor [Clostridia bacterium]